MLNSELRVVVCFHRHFQQPDALQRAELAVHQVQSHVLRVLQVLQQREELRTVNGQRARVEVFFLVALHLVQHLFDTNLILFISFRGGFFLHLGRFIHAQRPLRVLGNGPRVVGVNDVFVQVFHVSGAFAFIFVACVRCARKRLRPPDLPRKHEVARRAREDAVRAGRLRVQLLHGHRLLCCTGCALGRLRFARGRQRLPLLRLAVLVDFRQPLLLIHAQLVIAHRHPHHLKIGGDVVSGQQLLLCAAVVRRQAEDAPFKHVHVFQVRRVGVNEILFKPVKRVGQRLVRHGAPHSLGGFNAFAGKQGNNQLHEVVVAHGAVFIHCDAFIQFVLLGKHLDEPEGVARDGQHAVGRTVLHVVHDVGRLKLLLQPRFGNALCR